MNQEPVLCYVEGSWAYFTTQPLEKQWGDDWNDAPYEHNAGRPYGWSEKDGHGCICIDPEKGYKTYGAGGTGCGGDHHTPREPRPRYEIIVIGWRGPYEAPCDGTINSRFSVEQINCGDIAWLRPEWAPDGTRPIPAGTPPRDFCEAMRKAGGEVYVRPEDMEWLTAEAPAPTTGGTER